MSERAPEYPSTSVKDFLRTLIDYRSRMDSLTFEAMYDKNIDDPDPFTHITIRHARDINKVIHNLFESRRIIEAVNNYTSTHADDTHEQRIKGAIDHVAITRNMPKREVMQYMRAYTHELAEWQRSTPDSGWVRVTHIDAEGNAMTAIDSSGKTLTNISGPGESIEVDGPLWHHDSGKSQDFAPDGWPSHLK